MPQFELLDFKDIYKTEYLYLSEKNWIDAHFELDDHENLPPRFKKHPYYLKKLKALKFNEELNKL